MAQRFFNKGSRVKYVKPYVNKKVTYLEKNHELNLTDNQKETDKGVHEQNVKKNKQTKKQNNDMIDINKLDNLISSETENDTVSKTVKIEKSKGLIEREKSSKIILTEDNKMLLVD